MQKEVANLEQQIVQLKRDKEEAQEQKCIVQEAKDNIKQELTETQKLLKQSESCQEKTRLQFN